MKNFSKWFSTNAKLRKQDIICVFINTKLELSLFFPFKNKILFQNIKNFLEKEKNYFNESLIKSQFFKKFSEIDIFFSFQKKQISPKFVLELINKSKKLKTLFFTTNKKKNEVFLPQKEYSSFLISLILEFWVKIKIFNQNLEVRELNSFGLIQFRRKKMVPKLFFLKWEPFFKYFFFKKTKIIGKLIKLKLFYQLMDKNLIKTKREFFLKEKKIFENWSDIAQRIFEEAGFITVNFQNLKSHETIMIFNFF